MIPEIVKGGLVLVLAGITLGLVYGPAFSMGHLEGAALGTFAAVLTTIGLLVKTRIDTGEWVID